MKEVHLENKPVFTVVSSPKGYDYQTLLDKSDKYWADDLRPLAKMPEMKVNIYFTKVPDGYEKSHIRRGGITVLQYNWLGKITQADVFIIVYPGNDPAVDEVFVHEIGHVLGYGHSKEGIMQPIVYDGLL